MQRTGIAQWEGRKVRRKQEYVRLEPDASGVIHSRVFPGLRLAVQALIDGDMATVLELPGLPAP